MFPHTGPMAFSELRTYGFLWYINRVAFHPRGFALALVFDDDGNAIGFQICGRGEEPHSFGPSPEEAAAGLTVQDIEDDNFAKVEAVFEALRQADELFRQAQEQEAEKRLRDVVSTGDDDGQG